MDALDLAQRYDRVKGLLPPGVTLVAVSKKRTVEEVRALHALGHRDFGENYAQELRAKQPLLPGDIRWHFIGHLQRSNVKHILPIAHLIHGVDGAALMDEIEKRTAALGLVAHVLAQVHIAMEDTKHGLSPDETRSLIEAKARGRWPNVELCGLMGMASNTPDTGQVKAELEGLASLFAELRPVLGEGFSILSMGMSGDLEAALDAGSNMVRIGTAIFGERE